MYGWTREDFVHSGGHRKKRERRRESLVESLTSEEDELTSSDHISDDDHRIASGKGSAGRPRSQSGGLLEERGEREEKGGRRQWVATGRRGRQAAAHIQNYTTVTGIM